VTIIAAVKASPPITATYTGFPTNKENSTQEKGKRIVVDQTSSLIRSRKIPF
jgi:hypothetical protein